MTKTREYKNALEKIRFECLCHIGDKHSLANKITEIVNEAISHKRKVNTNDSSNSN